MGRDQVRGDHCPLGRGYALSVTVDPEIWEPVGFFGIRTGDTVRGVYTYKDGSTSDRIGTVIRVGTNGCWETESDQPVVMTDYVCKFHEVTRHLYRKRETFTFPRNMGAVVEGVHKNGIKGTKQQFIFDGEMWVRPGGIRDTEAYILSQFAKLETLSEGVNA